jgi:hypothetical protein
MGSVEGALGIGDLLGTDGSVRMIGLFTCHMIVKVHFVDIGMHPMQSTYRSSIILGST